MTDQTDTKRSVGEAFNARTEEFQNVAKLLDETLKDFLQNDALRLSLKERRVEYHMASFCVQHPHHAISFRVSLSSDGHFFSCEYNTVSSDGWTPRFSKERYFDFINSQPEDIVADVFQDLLLRLRKHDGFYSRPGLYLEVESFFNQKDAYLNTSAAQASPKEA